MTLRQIITAVIVFVVVAAVVALNIAFPAKPLTLKRELYGVMNTSCIVVAQAPSDRSELAEVSINAAQNALGEVEAIMSRYLTTGQVAAINTAEAGQPVDVSPELMVVLLAARDAATQTDGAFDVTVTPLIDLWKAAGQAGQLPDDGQIAQALGCCGWSHITLVTDTDPGQVIKDDALVQIDLGGIAKGYGIDQAMAAMQAAGAQAGMVNVGGDIGVFGPGPFDGQWEIDIRSPFVKKGYLGSVRVDAGVVATSGNYERFSTIDGVRYSHIVDPRTGLPAEASPSVTVWAPTGLQADLWATALSVLGEEGLALLPEGVEVMLVIGGPEAYRLVMTDGMKARFTREDGEAN
jgi:thiamine biosynthesis lipoprotein